MNRYVISIALVASIMITTGTSTKEATAANGWRWAKPMNQKVGSLFYTSNRKHTKNYRSNSRGWQRTPVYSTPINSYRRSSQSRTVYRLPTARPATNVPPPSAILVPRHPSASPQATVPAAPIVRPSPAVPVPAQTGVGH